jgi:hypothetical protein
MLLEIDNAGGKIMKKQLFAVLACALMLAACQKNEQGVGPAEHAGRKFDQATEKTGREFTKAAQEASEKLSQAARDANTKIKAASEDAGEKMEQAGQKLQNRDGTDNKSEDGKDAQK